MTVASRVLVAPIRWYQRFISPMLPATCRYYPTCSAYAVEALQVHGALRGSWLTIRRLGRCQPWSRREHFDPVPPARRSGPAAPFREPRTPSGSSATGDRVPHRGPGVAHRGCGDDSPDGHHHAYPPDAHPAVPTIDNSAGSRSA